MKVSYSVTMGFTRINRHEFDAVSWPKYRPQVSERIDILWTKAKSIEDYVTGYIIVIT